jgi:hypothetical protein
LSQRPRPTTKDRPIAFESRRLRGAELRYPVHEKELLAVVHALKKWKVYLEGRKFLVTSDHQSLVHLQTQKNLSGRQARWLDQLQSYDFELVYKKGEDNVVADALSRIPSPTTTIKLLAVNRESLNNISEVGVAKEITDKIKEQYPKDSYFGPVYQQMLNPDPKAAQKIKTKIKYYQIRDGLLYFVWGESNPRLCVPKDQAIRVALLQEFHDSPLAGHLGVHKTYENLCRTYFWPGMVKTVNNYVASCESCQRNKASNKSPQGLLQPLPIPQQRWEQVTMDFIVQLPKTKSGWDSIVVFVDRMTKRVHFAPTKTNATSPEIAQIFFDTVVKLHGLPRAIISDRDPKFTSLFWKSLFQRLGTKIKMSTAYHPQTDGQSERVNRVLEEMLRHFVNYHQNDWDTWLGLAEFAYNNAQQASTKMSPMYLDTGQHPITPGNLVVQPQEPRSEVEEVETFLQRQRAVLLQAQDFLVQAQQRQEAYANESRQPHPDYQVGDMVLLNNKNFTNPPDAQRPKRKLLPKFQGPYPITEKVGKVAFRLQLPHTLRIHDVFHTSMLKKYNPNPPEFQNRSKPPPPPVVKEDEEPEWEVESILDSRVRRNQVEYLVKWKGYPMHDSTWEKKINLQNAPKIIQQFEGSKLQGNKN